ncbi:hypothetical protein CC2G_005206 [Coprinopsis cinerea AmutBmut pab1-1]|nr:hypothetical protein CC2G_005206 [Coprinopsis cinerea AmutBmut pab1-1]
MPHQQVRRGKSQMLESSSQVLLLSCRLPSRSERADTSFYVTPLHRTGDRQPVIAHQSAARVLNPSSATEEGRTLSTAQASHSNQATWTHCKPFLLSRRYMLDERMHGVVGTKYGYKSFSYFYLKVNHREVRLPDCQRTSRFPDLRISGCPAKPPSSFKFLKGIDYKVTETRPDMPLFADTSEKASPGTEMSTTLPCLVTM